MDDEDARIENLTQEIDDVIAALKAEGNAKNRNESLAITKLEEAKFWLRNSLTATHWHKTSEDIPLNTYRCLVCDGDGLMALAYYSKGLWIFFDGKSVPFKDFEYWHPLPAKPIKDDAT